jgi:hypothetical protein
LKKADDSDKNSARRDPQVVLEELQKAGTFDEIGERDKNFFALALPPEKQSQHQEWH